MKKTSPWVAQAENNLEVSNYLIKEKYWSWSIFVSHQAMEIAIKGILQLLGKEPSIDPKLTYGEKESPHRVERLLQKLPFLLKKGTRKKDLEELFKKLDEDFENTRYPQDYFSPPPFQQYNKTDAENAYKVAENIVAHCKKVVETLEKAFESI